MKKASTYRVKSPADLACVPPALLGYNPHESVVAMCVNGRKIGLTLRFDLPPAEDFTGLASEVARYGRNNDMTSVAVVVYSDTPAKYAALVEEICGTVPVTEAIWVRGGRFASYLCSDQDCCPPDGLPLADSEAVTAILAERVLAGDVFADTRQDLVRRFDPEEIDEALADQASAEADRIRNLTVRDHLLLATIREGGMTVRVAAEHWTQVARRCIGDDRDVALTMAAAFYYLDGDGTLTNIALESMAGATSLGGLLTVSLEHGLPPSVFRECILTAEADMPPLPAITP